GSVTPEKRAKTGLKEASHRRTHDRNRNAAMARKNRPEPTLADYMAIAISPALIIVLVSSVAFFLLTMSYGGAFEGSAQWTMGCFCFAAVLISRVSIVEGAERAAMFGVVLAAAV